MNVYKRVRLGPRVPAVIAVAQRQTPKAGIASDSGFASLKPGVWLLPSIAGHSLQPDFWKKFCVHVAKGGFSCLNLDIDLVSGPFWLQTVFPSKWSEEHPEPILKMQREKTVH